MLVTWCTAYVCSITPDLVSDLELYTMGGFRRHSFQILEPDVKLFLYGVTIL